MASSAAPDNSHRGLLSAVRSVQSAAMRRDLDAVHRRMCELRSLLVAHLHAEEKTFENLSPIVRDAVQAGQRRLLQRLDGLLAQVESDDGDCRCLVEAAELALLVARQARFEARVSQLPRGGSPAPAVLLRSDPQRWILDSSSATDSKSDTRPG